MIRKVVSASWSRRIWAARSLVSVGLSPVFIVVLGVLHLGERLALRERVGMALATVGTLVVIVARHDVASVLDGSLVGVGALLFSAFCFAAFTAFGKELVRRYSAFEAVTYSTVLSVPLFGVPVPLELSLRGIDPGSLPTTPAVVATVVYLSVLSTAAAWYCWYKGMEYADASTVAVFLFAQPDVGVLLGVALLAKPSAQGSPQAASCWRSASTW